VLDQLLEAAVEVGGKVALKLPLLGHSCASQTISWRDQSKR
jgi:hypothetical protein